MSLPKTLLNHNTHRIMIGGTNIYISTKEHKVTINHAGNPEDTIHTVERNVDAALGDGTLKWLKDKAKDIYTDGKPNYLFTMKLEFK